MRKPAVAVVLALALSASSSAQVIIGGVGGGGGGGGLAVGQPAADCTAKALLYADGSKNIQCNGFVYDSAGGAGVPMLQLVSVPATEAVVRGMAGTNGGASATNAGLAGFGARDSGTYSYGVYGAGRAAATHRFGGYFTIGVSNAVPLPSGVGALAADNLDSTSDIFVVRDNGTSVMTIIDGGAHWTKQSSKTLADAVATAFVRIGVSTNVVQGGIIDYCVSANTATPNSQARCGSVPISLVNEGGTESCVAGTPSDTDNTPTGTMTLAFTGASNAADTCDFLANADSSLTTPTIVINYTVRLFGTAATTVTGL